MTLGEKLRQLRQQRGLTQAEVAGEAITRNMLSLLEHDQAAASVKTLRYLSQRLGVPLSALLEEETREENRLEAARACYLAGDDEGCLAALDSVSCKPPPKLAVSKHLHAGSSPAWRLNSALRASNNAAKACGRCLACCSKKQHNFFTSLWGKNTAGPAAALHAERIRKLRGVPGGKRANHRTAGDWRIRLQGFGMKASCCSPSGMLY